MVTALYWQKLHQFEYQTETRGAIPVPMVTKSHRAVTFRMEGHAAPTILGRCRRTCCKPTTVSTPIKDFVNVPFYMDSTMDIFNGRRYNRPGLTLDFPLILRTISRRTNTNTSICLQMSSFRLAIPQRSRSYMAAGRKLQRQRPICAAQVSEWP